MSLLRDMQENGIMASAGVYNVVIGTCGVERNYKMAEVVYNMSKGRGDVNCDAALIGAAKRCGEVEKGVQTFRDFIRKGVVVDVGTFNDVMSMVDSDEGVLIFEEVLNLISSRSLTVKGLSSTILKKDILDTHAMSTPSSLIALRYAVEQCSGDLVVVVGKGKGSGEQVIGKEVIKWVFERGGECEIDQQNTGRIRIPFRSLQLMRKGKI